MKGIIRRKSARITLMIKFWLIGESSGEVKQTFQLASSPLASSSACVRVRLGARRPNRHVQSTVRCLYTYVYAHVRTCILKRHSYRAVPIRTYLRMQYSCRMLKGMLQYVPVLVIATLACVQTQKIDQEEIPSCQGVFDFYFVLDRCVASK